MFRPPPELQIDLWKLVRDFMVAVPEEELCRGGGSSDSNA